MSLLAAPLESDQLNAIRARFPGFRGELPEEAKYWSKADVEAFLGSGGASRPREALKSSQTCALLTRARLKLAEDRISETTGEYRSFCRQWKDSRENWKLSSVAESVEVQRAAAVPAGCRCPLVVEKRRDWRARLWNMDFWKHECGDARWVCHARCPRFQDDTGGADAFSVEANVAEYVDYARMVHRMDRKCLEENALAFPRVGLHGWAPFCDRMLPLVAGFWQELGPPGVKDLTHRWVQLFATAFSTDWCEALARYYQISIRPTGGIERLHASGHGAHLWLNQIEGRAVYYLFAPSEASNLYAGYTTGESPVDLYFPSAKRHPRFSEAKAQVAVLYLGQTLVIPAGWWWYSVALEPSVTLSHYFWNMENKVHFTESLRENFDFSTPASRSAKENIAANLDFVHQQVMADEDSDADE